MGLALLLHRSKTLHHVMLELVYDALKRSGGNRTVAARELGVTVRCMRNWIKRYDELADFRRIG